MIRIVTTPIDIGEVLNSIRDAAAGGTALFVGTTRNHAEGKEVVALEYEAYIPMAQKVLEDIAVAAGAKWKTTRISIVHRIGRLMVGEASVAVAVSSAHRREAFEACRYCIDTLKRDAPIWKKEHFAGGSAWSGGNDPPADRPQRLGMQ